MAPMIAMWIVWAHMLNDFFPVPKEKIQEVRRTDIDKL